MSVLKKHLEKVNFRDKQFIGTIAFRSEEITLPDGSKVALGIDDGYWVLIYQQERAAPFQVYKYDQIENKIYLDQKAGGTKEFQLFKKHLNYFYQHAQVDDLVTILPTRT